MRTKSMCRVHSFGFAISLSVVFAACSGPVPVGNNPGGTTSTSGGGTGNGSSTPESVSTGSGGGSSIALKPGATNTNTSITTDVTEKENCGVTTNEMTKQPANLLLVLDRSSSMTYGMDTNTACRDSNCVARWPTMKTALAQVLTISANDVNWGLKFFSTPNQGDCTVNNGVEVPIAAGNMSQINAAINNASPGGRTPTRKAINAAVAYLKGLTSPGTKSILLATDGQPNCKGDTVNTTDDVEGTTAAIKAAHDAGFKVYILGIGPEMSAAALNGFADAGGTAIPDVSGPGKNYYAALSAEELSKQLASIVGEVASCTFALSTPPPDPTNVVIEFDGDRSLRAPRDTTHTDGWDYTSSSHTGIQLYGSWCDRVMKGTFKSSKVLFGCPNIPIP